MAAAFVSSLRIEPLVRSFMPMDTSAPAKRVIWHLWL